MKPHVVIHVADSIAQDKEVIERLVNKNIEGKLSGYLRKYDEDPNAKEEFEIFIGSERRRFTGKLLVELAGKSYRYEREDYSKLDDLINHLFMHLKESLSAGK